MMAVVVEADADTVGLAIYPCLHRSRSRSHIPFARTEVAAFEAGNPGVGTWGHLHCARGSSPVAGAGVAWLGARRAPVVIPEVVAWVSREGSLRCRGRRRGRRVWRPLLLSGCVWLRDWLGGEKEELGLGEGGSCRWVEGLEEGVMMEVRGGC